MKTNMRTMRDEAGLTQAQLAESAGVTKVWVAKLESGRTAGQLSLRCARAIAAALGRTVDEVFPEEGVEGAEPARREAA